MNSVFGTRIDSDCPSSDEQRGRLEPGRKAVPADLPSIRLRTRSQMVEPDMLCKSLKCRKGR